MSDDKRLKLFDSPAETTVCWKNNCRPAVHSLSQTAEEWKSGRLWMSESADHNGDVNDDDGGGEDGDVMMMVLIMCERSSLEPWNKKKNPVTKHCVNVIFVSCMCIFSSFILLVFLF